MRKLTIIFGLLLFTACSRPGTLKPAEVLQRTALESAKLQSFAFQGTLQISFDRGKQEMLPLSGNVTMDVQGISQDGGAQAQASVTVQGNLVSDGTSHALQGGFETFAVQSDAVYLRVSELIVTPPHPMLRQDVMETLNMGTWWRLPGNPSQPAGQQVAPDPGFVRLQAEVIAVDRDYGLVTVNGRDAYHYNVHIDSDKISAFLRRASQEQGTMVDEASIAAFLQNFGANGEVWIDAETFHVRRIRWNIRPSSVDSAATIDLNITQHNSAQRITAPTDAEDLPESFIPGAVTIDDGIGASGGTLSY